MLSPKPGSCSSAMTRPSTPSRRIASASHSVDAPLPHSTMSAGRSVITRSTSTASRSGDAAQPRVAGSRRSAGTMALRFCSASSWRKACLTCLPLSASSRRTVSSVRLLSAARLPIRLARSRLCLISSRMAPSSGPSAISATVGTAPALVASPSPSAPASQPVTSVATVSVRTVCKISRRMADSLTCETPIPYCVTFIRAFIERAAGSWPCRAALGRSSRPAYRHGP